MSKKIKARNNKKNKKGKQLPSMVEGVTRRRVEGPHELPEGTKTFTTLTEDDIIILNAFLQVYYKKHPEWNNEERYFLLDNSKIGEGDRIVLQYPGTGQYQYFCYTYENLIEYMFFCLEKNGWGEQK